MENQRLRRQVSELEQTIQLMRASTGAQRWLLKSSGAAASASSSSRPSTTTAAALRHDPRPDPKARVEGPAPKLRPKTDIAPKADRRISSASSCGVSTVQQQILTAVERSQEEVAAQLLPSAAEAEANGSGSGEGWTTAAWITSLRASQILSSALLAPLGRAATGGGGSRLELA